MFTLHELSAGSGLPKRRLWWAARSRGILPARTAGKVWLFTVAESARLIAAALAVRGYRKGFDERCENA